MKLLLLSFCLAVLVTVVLGGCASLRDPCSATKNCCNDLQCVEINDRKAFCEERKTTLVRCKSDAECNGVRGSCSRGGFCLEICRSDADCGTGTCMHADFTTGGICRHCKFDGESCLPSNACCDESKHCIEGQCVLIPTEEPGKRCSSDKQCNGVRGSCSRGFCEDICRSDSDCGLGTCFGASSAIGGKCINCRENGKSCRTGSTCCSESDSCIKGKCVFDPSRCKSDADCNGVKDSCSKGFCIADCLTNTDCSGIRRACIQTNSTIGGLCRDCKSNGESCRDEDICCGPTFRCDKGKCTHDPAQRHKCASDSDCAGVEGSCSDGFCSNICVSDATCNGVKGSCKHGLCLNICDSDADCGGSGKLCANPFNTGGFWVKCKINGESCTRTDLCCNGGGSHHRRCPTTGKCGKVPSA